MKKRIYKKRKNGRTIKPSKHQIGKSVRRLDKKHTALKPGKRISRNGIEYYEYRKNRSDLKNKV